MSSSPYNKEPYNKEPYNSEPDTALPTIELRPAQLDDAAALLAFRLMVLGETEFLLQGLEDISAQEQQERNLITSFARHERCLLLLAWEGDEVVGMCTVVAGGLARSHHVGQTGMAVRRSHWRRGVASQLLTSAVRWSSDVAAFYKLSLQVHASNDAARRLYERHGFHYEGTLRGEALLDGAYVDLLAMGRFLA